MVLATLISQYLVDNRRLVIPQLGALLVKEPDHKIIFSSLLKRDDGVLRSLITNSGASEIEASAIVSRMLFEVRYAVENNEKYLLDGVGEFSSGAEGAILFTHISDVTPTVEEPLLQEPIQDELFSAESSEEEQIETQQSIDSDKSEASPEHELQITSAFDPDLDGLRYGPSKRTRRTARRGGIDIWMVLAIVVAVIAIGAILYGFLRDGSDFRMSDNLENIEVIENPEGVDVTTDEGVE